MLLCIRCEEYAEKVKRELEMKAKPCRTLEKLAGKLSVNYLVD